MKHCSGHRLRIGQAFPYLLLQGVQSHSLRCFLFHGRCKLQQPWAFSKAGLYCLRFFSAMTLGSDTLAGEKPSAYRAPKALPAPGIPTAWRRPSAEGYRGPLLNLPPLAVSWPHHQPSTNLHP